MTELKVDIERMENNLLKDFVTGILVRAKGRGGMFVNVDIADLTKESLLAWLRSRGGANEWAENCVGILLGHGNLHDAGTQET